MKLLRRWWWVLLLVPLVGGLARLRLDVDVLNLLPVQVPAAQGLKLYQQHFANARELILTVQAADAEAAEAAARSLAEQLRRAPGLAAEVTWQPPWLEHPGQAGEWIAYLWLNQPPAAFAQLTNRLLAPHRLDTLQQARQQLATTLSPLELERLAYDPFGLTRLPETITSGVPTLGSGLELFSSADGTFRVIFVKPAASLASYRQCARWMQAIKAAVGSWRAANSSAGEVKIGFTGGPAFMAEIASQMEHDMQGSVLGTLAIIAGLFWWVHRRWRPMLWLLVLLVVILAGTLALGGLLIGTLNVLSVGFAAILLGLAVDYGLVLYQEAVAAPGTPIRELRRAIAPSIRWAAITTAAAFLTLNWSGLPGLAQLGTLVALGVGLAAGVMLYAYLPPLEGILRRDSICRATMPAAVNEPVFVAQASLPAGSGGIPANSAGVEPCCAATRSCQLGMWAITGLLLVGVALILSLGVPRLDHSAEALRPRGCEAFATLEVLKASLGQKEEPYWLLVGGTNEAEVGQRLNAVFPRLNQAAAQHPGARVVLPSLLWPDPARQSANRALAQTFVEQRDAARQAALANGFTAEALQLTEGILGTWQRAVTNVGTFWPANAMSRWILDQATARKAGEFFALGLIYPGTNAAPAALADWPGQLARELPRDGVWLTSWPTLGEEVLRLVQSRFWRVLGPMILLLVISLWLAFHRVSEVLLSLATLAVSGLCLLAIMRLAGWSWNLLNLMALPLLLGAGVDYSIHMQLALRRHQGDAAAVRQIMGRAVLLCGGTTVAGFGSLAWSSNAGLASLGQVCATGIGATMLIAIFLLPAWWQSCVGRTPSPAA